jgi:hypothetical protein
MVRTVNFVTDIMLPFVLNRKLIEGLAISEIPSFRAEQVKWVLQHNTDKVEIWFTRDLDNLLDTQNISAIPLMGIPGGFLGFQAWYLILENFWRNLIKHNVKNVGKNSTVVIHLEIVDKQKTPFWTIKLWAEIETDKKACEEINRILKAGIIDAEGKLIPEGWGTKEMLVGACYLKGLPIMHANERGDQVLRCYMRDDKYLCYEFDVMKPMELLIVGCKAREDLQKNLRSRGIYIMHHVPQDFIVPTEYLITPDTAHEEWTSWNDSLKPIKCFSRSLDISELEDNNKSLELLIQLESEFAQSLTDGKNTLYFILHPANPGDPEYRVWENLKMDSNSKLQLFVIVFGIDEWNRERLQEFIQEKVSQQNVCVILDRHGECMDAIIKIARAHSDKLFWEPYGGGTQTSFTLSHVPNDDRKKLLLLWRIANAALLKVAILDERLQQILDPTDREEVEWKYGNGSEPGISAIECLRFMRVFIPRTDELNLENPEEDKIHQWICANRPHILSIHAGILDKIGKKTPDDVLKWTSSMVECMDSKVKRIIIHSGRGIPTNVPELKVPFVGYSAVEHYTVSRDLKSKYALVQELLSARGVKR